VLSSLMPNTVQSVYASSHNTLTLHTDRQTTHRIRRTVTTVGKTVLVKQLD